MLLASLTVCNLRHFVIVEHIVKSDNKRPFRTFLKYDKEIKNEEERERRELSDLSTNLPPKILRKQFPEIAGLADASLGIFGQFTTHKDEFTQIVHRNQHWIVVEGKKKENPLNIYDSLAKESQQKRKIVYEICQRWWRNKKQLTINTKFLKSQGNGLGCGVSCIKDCIW